MKSRDLLYPRDRVVPGRPRRAVIVWTPAALSLDRRERMLALPATHTAASQPPAAKYRALSRFLRERHHAPGGALQRGEVKGMRHALRPRRGTCLRQRSHNRDMPQGPPRLPAARSPPTTPRASPSHPPEAPERSREPDLPLRLASPAPSPFARPARSPRAPAARHCSRTVCAHPPPSAAYKARPGQSAARSVAAAR